MMLPSIFEKILLDNGLMMVEFMGLQQYKPHEHRH